MKIYGEYAPTGFDGSGAFLSDRQDWYVVPVDRNRDSEPISESNFAVALEMLGDEGDNVEVHRFGHWGCGWFEIIIIRPGSPEERIGEEIVAKLDDYCILDEDDLAIRENEMSATVPEKIGHLSQKSLLYEAHILQQVYHSREE